MLTTVSFQMPSLFLQSIQNPNTSTTREEMGTDFGIWSHFGSAISLPEVCPKSARCRAAVELGSGCTSFKPQPNLPPKHVEGGSWQRVGSAICIKTERWKTRCMSWMKHLTAYLIDPLFDNTALIDVKI